MSDTFQNKHSLNILGVVGARSGSKSIKDKNIKLLFGKPLMAWIIEAAKRSKYLTRLILSTDSEKYARIGRKLGIEVPFIRSKKYASDKADDISYLTHAVRWLEKHEGYRPDVIVRLIPTTPLARPASIDACVKLLISDPTATSARTIEPAPKHPYKLWRIDDDELVPFVDKRLTGLSEPSNAPRQALPPAYAHIDVIAVRYETLMFDKLLTGKRIRYQILEEEAVDIDSETDFLVAEILLKRRFKIDD